MEIKLQRLKRFDPAKHEQLEGLLQWCKLMGLTGKDLVSLGGHIDRLQSREEVESNLSIVRGIQLYTVGGDPKPDNRCMIKTAKGKYRIEADGHFYCSLVTVFSYATKVKQSHRIKNHYELGKVNWRKRAIYSALLDWHHGHLVLDF